ncbi:MAG: hypothetical protein K6T28_01420 [Acidothermus sp.]|nr:hypothetical protein [Acidothermus sp.]
MAVTAEPIDVGRDDARRPSGGRAWLVGGFLARAWLWFLAGCVAVTFVPLAFGWHPYLVQTGSMKPRIQPGDVVLAAPQHDPRKLVGHVTVFVDPTRHGEIVTHRVLRLNPDGTLLTKGDANQSPDSAPVAMSQVRGMGRLLVRWIGLPVLWAKEGRWVPLAGVVVSVLLAAALVVRDRDEDADEDDAEPPSLPAPPEVRAGEDHGAADYRPVTGLPRQQDDEETGELDPGVAMTSGAVAAVASARSRRGYVGRHRRPRRAFAGGLPRWRRAAATIGVAGVGGAGLTIPTTQAAFSAATSATSNTWTAGSGYNYTAEVNALGPWLYWKLDDANTTAADASGNGRPGVYNRNNRWTHQVVGALPDQTPNLAATSAGSAPGGNVPCIFTAQNADFLPPPGPSVYSLVVWFRTAPGYSNGGKLIGLESSRGAVSDSTAGGQYDRMVYMDGAGHLWFGVWKTNPGVAVAVQSPATYNDGAWHMAVAVMNATTGMTLYVDGQPVAANANTVSETDNQNMYWRAGCGNLAGWGAYWTGPNNPGTTQANYPFAGSLDEVAVFLTALTQTQIADLYFYR